MSTPSTVPTNPFTGAVIFDTNAYRVLTFGRNLSDCRALGVKLREKEKLTGIKAYAHPIVIWELFAHLADPGDLAYENCLNSIICLDEHTATPEGCGGIRLIADSYHTATRNLFNGLLPKGYEESVRNLTTMVSHVSKHAPDLSDSVCQQNLTQLSQGMAKKEADWITSMEKVVDGYLPGMAKAVFGGTADKKAFAAVQKFLRSDHFFKVWSIGFVMDRAASVGIFSLPKEEFAAKAKLVREAFPTPFHLLRTLLLKLAQTSPIDLANPNRKRWNFIWDSIICFSVGPGHIEGQPAYLVTGDGEITDAAKEAAFGNHVLKLDDYLSGISFPWTP